MLRDMPDAASPEVIRDKIEVFRETWEGTAGAATPPHGDHTTSQPK